MDGLFFGHIKGQFLYRGEGGIPYYIDGGAGGELYTEGPVGTDHGYWHGFRLIRVANGRVTTDTVPIFTKDGIRLEGPATLNPGRQGQYEAFGSQPVFNDPAKVPNLELRDPDPRPPASSSGVGAFVRGGGWIFVPVLLLVLGGMAMNGTLPAPRRRVLVLGCAARRRGRDGRGRRVAGAAVRAHHHAAREPAHPRAHLHVQRPAGGRPARRPRAMTRAATRPRRPRAACSRARCPGRARVSITSGFETTAKSVLVPVRRPAGSRAACAP